MYEYKIASMLWNWLVQMVRKSLVKHYHYQKWLEDIYAVQGMVEMFSEWELTTAVSRFRKFKYSINQIPIYCQILNVLAKK